MPLSAQEKNDIAIGSALGIRPAEFARLSFERKDPELSFLFGTQVAQLSELFSSRIRFPQLSPGDIARAALAAGEGFAISSDPFFGDVVISTPDQADHLTELVRESAIRRVLAEQDTSRLFLERRAFMERQAATAQERGFATAIDPNLRGGLLRATAESPLQFIEGDFLA